MMKYKGYWGSVIYDDDAEVFAAVVASENRVGDLMHGHGTFGDEDEIRASSHARAGCDPPRETAHHLDNHHSVMRFGRRVNTVNGVHGDVDGTVESKGIFRAGHVVVNRLGDADDLDLLFIE